MGLIIEVPQRKQLHETYARLMDLRFDHPELFTPTATLNWQVTPLSGRVAGLSGSHPLAMPNRWW